MTNDGFRDFMHLGFPRGRWPMPEFCRVGLPNSQVKLLWSASSLNCQSLDTHEVVRILFRVPGMITILLFAICFSTRNLRELPHLRSLTRSVCVCEQRIWKVLFALDACDRPTGKDGGGAPHHGCADRKPQRSLPGIDSFAFQTSNYKR